MEEFFKDFLENTKENFKKQSLDKQEPLQKPYKSRDIINLTEPELLKDHYINFLEMVELRSTKRIYKEEAITLNELSYLLWTTQGVKAITDNNMTLRTVPSAGARHAFETYLIIQNVEGLKKGIYRFLALEHKLIFVSDIPKEIISTFLSMRVVEKSAVTMLWVARAKRMTETFGNRGYRYLFIDIGHVCQNLYLAAQTLDIGVCPLGAFDDEKLNGSLNLDGINEFVIYGASLGKI